MKEHTIINLLLLYHMARQGNVSTFPDKLVKRRIFTFLPFCTNIAKLTLGRSLLYFCHPAFDGKSPINRDGFQFRRWQVVALHDRRKHQALNARFIIIKSFQSSCIL